MTDWMREGGPAEVYCTWHMVDGTERRGWMPVTIVSVRGELAIVRTHAVAEDIECPVTLLRKPQLIDAAKIRIESGEEPENQ